ncbi:hypothetical protein HETIRDRAFT_453400 [Heterobasidion irregulare TC 32-1]|uniref:Uncharacterized protein n=1 Tax=Heterobasidion irregulare (strain TC 32-1) TaxID=747525 RepID=W4JZ37_HETIT|nr:uncharacterized protein HETIRDRAFT_453400 [Heterobasidion irregulare TC 32-1]ETW78828.1 hypothetical protein HETIRDRAFT_453400 [Heterobasidion irregulare TC 32-1]
MPTEHRTTDTVRVHMCTHPHQRTLERCAGTVPRVHKQRPEPLRASPPALAGETTDAGARALSSHYPPTRTRVHDMIMPPAEHRARTHTHIDIDIDTHRRISRTRTEEALLTNDLSAAQERADSETRARTLVPTACTVFTAHVHDQRLVARLDTEIADAAQAPRRCTDMSIQYLSIDPPAARPSPSNAVQRAKFREIYPPPFSPTLLRRAAPDYGAARHLRTMTHCVTARAHTISPSTEHLSESTKNANDREELEFSAGQPRPARPRLERQSRGCPARTPSRGRGRG